MEKMDGIFTSGTQLLLSIGSSKIWLTDNNNKNMSKGAEFILNNNKKKEKTPLIYSLF